VVLNPDAEIASATDVFFLVNQSRGEAETGFGKAGLLSGA
jgi:hypothetical protein